MNAIKASGLVKQYKNLTAVNMLSITIQRGELSSLLCVNCEIHGFSREKTKAKITNLFKSLSLDPVLNRKAVIYPVVDNEGSVLQCL